MKIALIISAMAAAVLAGCASQVGDRLADRQRDYCAEISPVARAAAIAVVRSQVPVYPTSGLCTDAEQALADEIARRLEEGAVIDIEQARRDQERYSDAIPD